MTRTGSFLVLLLVALPLHAQPVKWQPYESPAGKFRAAFPGAPTVRHGRRGTEIGDVVTARYSAGDRAGATYDITFSDYPREGIARLSAAKLMDAVRDGLVYLAKGKLVSEKPYTLGRFAGREQEIEGADGMRYRVRLLLVENRLYQLTAMARPPDKAEEQKFFGSFRLTGATRP